MMEAIENFLRFSGGSKSIKRSITVVNIAAKTATLTESQSNKLIPVVKFSEMLVSV